MSHQPSAKRGFKNTGGPAANRKRDVHTFITGKPKINGAKGALVHCRDDSSGGIKRTKCGWLQ